MPPNPLAPLLTERDPVESAEGGLDPLGTEALADALAVQLVPGVRERQRHPRFLTAIAVSLEICREFDEDTLAADGVSEPWQVFEWYLVEGLVRRAEESERTGLPGSQKAARAIDDGVPLSAKRYLKSPSVFGFHGVYRQLARSVNMESNGNLGEVGFELLNVWAKEQGLEGFVGTGGGPGRAVRSQLADAVQAGLEQGATSRSSTWSGWDFFRKHLAPYNAGPNESQFIWAALLNDPKGFRRDTLEFLVSPQGGEVWQSAWSERAFHHALRITARDELRVLLDAVDAFETFARLCHDAFQDCLFELTRQRAQKTPPSALAALDSVQRAAKLVPDSCDSLMERLEPVGEATRFRETFASLVEPSNPLDWVQRLIEHHRKTQARKPPNGKNPWFERFDDGGLMIRSDYTTDQRGSDDNSYVHLYRTRSLWQFGIDLGLVKP